VLEHLHSYPAYAAAFFTLVLLVLAALGHLTYLRRAATVLLAVNVSQMLVGIIQSRSGLPPLLVGTHMLLACVVAACATVVLYRVRKS
jgi:cytochrome c oxidase assembly protein subunit 15